MKKELLKSKKNIIIMSGILLVIVSLFYGINVYVNNKVKAKLLMHLGRSLSGKCKFNHDNYVCAEQAMKTVGFFDKISFINNDKCFEYSITNSVKGNEKFFNIFVNCTLFMNEF